MWAILYFFSQKTGLFSALYPTPCNKKRALGQKKYRGRQTPASQACLGLLISLVSCYKVSKLVGKTLILSIESGSMCKHQGSSSFLWLNRTLCGIIWQYTLLGKKKENISAEKEGFTLCWVKGKDCCRRGRILKHSVQDELKRIKIFLSRISTPSLINHINNVIIKVEFRQLISSDYSNPPYCWDFLFFHLQGY